MLTSNCTDVSTTIIVKPGPVLEFLCFNQNVRDARQIDWNKVELDCILVDKYILIL